MLHASPTYTSALSGEGNFSTGNPPSNNEKSANTYAMHSATEITITAISTIASILFIFCLLRYLFRRFRVKIFPLLGNLFAKLSRRRRRNVVQETVSQTNQQTAPSGRLIKLELKLKIYTSLYLMSCIQKKKTMNSLELMYCPQSIFQSTHQILFWSMQWRCHFYSLEQEDHSSKGTFFLDRFVTPHLYDPDQSFCSSHLNTKNYLALAIL